jgi:hypothetical protein
MSLEEALAANTAAVKELTAALLAAGALQTAQASSAAASSPAVKAVVKAQKEADAKKSAPSDTSSGASVNSAASGGQTANESKQCGEPSASTPTSSSQEQPSELHPWHEKTAKLFSELQGGEPTLENLRKAILGINQQIGRAQAEAVLQRFGAQAITPKDGKTGLDTALYERAFALCLDVLAGRDDATLAKSE